MRSRVETWILNVIKSLQLDIFSSLSCRGSKETNNKGGPLSKKRGVRYAQNGLFNLLLSQKQITANYTLWEKVLYAIYQFQKRLFKLHRHRDQIFSFFSAVFFFHIKAKPNLYSTLKLKYSLPSLKTRRW